MSTHRPESPRPGPHRPETGRFAETFEAVGAALDRWLASDRVDPLLSPTDWRGELTGPLPQTGIGADAAIAEFTSLVLPHGPHLTSDASWGWITTGPSTVPTAMLAAGMIASPQRQTLTSFNLLEEQALDWLAELCGLGDGMKGVFSSGGSTANLIALGAARQWALEQQGIDPVRRRVRRCTARDLHLRPGAPHGAAIGRCAGHRTQEGQVGTDRRSDAHRRRGARGGAERG